MEQPILPAVHRMFYKTDHILGLKANINKYKIIEIISHMLSYHNEIKLEISSKRNYKNYNGD
jgi:hypothetical protein